MEDWEEFFAEKSRRRSAKERSRQLGVRTLITLVALGLILFTGVLYLIQ